MMIKDTKQQKQDKVRVIASKFYSKNRQQQMDREKIRVKSMASLTNDVFKVSAQGMEDLLIKLYHRGMPQFADTKLEAQLVGRLGDQEFYPSVLYQSQHYRIEQFINSVEISPKAIKPELVLQAIKQLTIFSSSYKEFVLEYNQFNNIRSRFQFQEQQNNFWKIFERKKQNCPEKVQQCRESIQSTYGNRSIMVKLGKILAETERVLSHNDLHLGNVLITKHEKVYLIDFQFSQFNYLGFDIGNFLNQWSTDYGEKDFEIRADWEMPKQLKDEVVKTYFTSMKRSYSFRGTQSDLDLYVQIGRVLSHLFWISVGLKQIDDKRIGFSMTYYIRRRCEEFHKHFCILEQMLDS